MELRGFVKPRLTPSFAITPARPHQRCGGTDADPETRIVTPALLAHVDFEPAEATAAEAPAA